MDKVLRSWQYTEVRDNADKIRFQSLNPVEAQFFAKKLLEKEGVKPNLLEYDRTEADSPK